MGFLLPRFAMTLLHLDRACMQMTLLGHRVLCFGHLNPSLALGRHNGVIAIFVLLGAAEMTTTLVLGTSGLNICIDDLRTSRKPRLQGDLAALQEVLATRFLQAT